MPAMREPFFNMPVLITLALFIAGMTAVGLFANWIGPQFCYGVGVGVLLAYIAVKIDEHDRRTGRLRDHH